MGRGRMSVGGRFLAAQRGAFVSLSQEVTCVNALSNGSGQVGKKGLYVNDTPRGVGQILRVRSARDRTPV